MSEGTAAALGAKCHVLYSRLLKADEYWALLNKKSIIDIAVFLKQTPGYKDKLQDIIPENTNRLELESTLHSAIFIEADSCLHYIDGIRREFFSAWLALFEADQLKTILRRIFHNRMSTEKTSKTPFQIPQSVIRFDKLLECSNLASALETLKGTPYYNVIDKSLKQYTKDNNVIFNIEIAIDTFVELKLYETLQKLPKDEKKILLHIFGVRADLLNIYHFYRCLWYFQMSAKEALNYILPFQYHISKDFLLTLADIKAQEQRLALLEKKFPQYGRIFRSVMSDNNSELALETAVWRYIYTQTLSAFKNGVPGFHTAIAYFILKAYELSDITEIIEDVRYGKQTSSAAQYLIRPLLNNNVS